VRNAAGSTYTMPFIGLPLILARLAIMANIRYEQKAHA
jgi:hypothetical protein